VKADRITVNAERVRKVGTDECNQLTELYESGDRVHGLVDTFSWMPFKVVDMEQHGDNVTFELRMVSK